MMREAIKRRFTQDTELPKLSTKAKQRSTDLTFTLQRENDFLSARIIYLTLASPFFLSKHSQIVPVSVR